MSVKPIPDGYSTVTPYLIVKGAANAIDYYKMAFDAQELMRMPGPGRKDRACRTTGRHLSDHAGG